MLIVLEGLDGAGKSTQLRLLSDYIASKGHQVEHMHFPRYEAPVIGEMIAGFLRGDFGAIDTVHPKVVAYLFAQDRRDAAASIRDRLASGKCVVLDRYVYSNIAFQCSKVDDPSQASALRDWIFRTEYEEFAIPKPDLNIFLDVPISFVDDKLKHSREGDDNREYLHGKSDIHEASIEFQKKVRAIYLKQCELDSSFIRIDCSSASGAMLPSEEIFAKIRSHVDKL